MWPLLDHKTIFRYTTNVLSPNICMIYLILMFTWCWHMLLLMFYHHNRSFVGIKPCLAPWDYTIKEPYTISIIVSWKLLLIYSMIQVAKWFCMICYYYLFYFLVNQLGHTNNIWLVLRPIFLNPWGRYISDVSDGIAGCFSKLFWSICRSTADACSF